MGQQQLLLIILGVIIVGVAVVIGINLFNANEKTAEIDNVTIQLQSMASMAQTYYKKPITNGGGGRNFDGWAPPLQNPGTGSAPHISAGSNAIFVSNYQGRVGIYSMILDEEGQLLNIKSWDRETGGTANSPSESAVWVITLVVNSTSISTTVEVK
jgi:type II secretory pathway pseudopilin PulG